MATSSPMVLASPARGMPQPVGSGPGPIAPLSARQRKQVYLHSAIFDSKGVPPQSMYSQSKQQTVLAQVQQQNQPAMPRPQSMQLPSPADLKATANHGHSVITWDSPMPATSRQANGAPPVQDNEFMRFGESGDHFKVIKANKDTGAIQREFVTLHWADQRCETMRTPNQRLREERASLDASARKMQDMSSEVLGNHRRLQKSTTCPSNEIRSVPMLNVHSIDSATDRRAALSQQAEPTPRSAREHRSGNLGVSKSSPFCGRDEQQKKDGSQSARGEDLGRRRNERNYSDIFGTASGAAKEAKCSSPRLLRQSSEGHRAAGLGMGDSGSVIYRPHISARARQAFKDEAPQESVLPVTPRCKPIEANPQAKQVQAEERACWDTRVGMDLGAEIARRVRGNRTGEGAADGRSASERKLQELGSRNARGGLGIPQPAYEEENLRRVASASPMNKGGSFRTLQPAARSPDSARSRKLSHMQSKIVF